MIAMKHAVSGRLCSLILSVVAGCASAIGVTFNVTGEVADSVGEPEIYATVRVYAVADSVKPVSLGTTDGEGRFTERGRGIPPDGGFGRQSTARKRVRTDTGESQSQPGAPCHT